ncbi:hypothetical protein [Gordonia sp. (in: high G+C Gram-positive bacteria)]|uniref:hypothetical protein n=1 Tax=Gordonia sp. (in: high G+C Gram-positive bacteria) TaxID=84139 RepID=UPI003F9AE3E0
MTPLPIPDDGRKHREVRERKLFSRIRPKDRGAIAVAVDQAIAHPGSGDDRTWYDLQMSAALPDGRVLHRRLHLERERLGRRVGGAVRFRHNSLDPDAHDDVYRLALSLADRTEVA